MAFVLRLSLKHFAPLCLYFPLVSDATALPQGGDVEEAQL